MKLVRYGIIPYLCNEDSVANDYRFLDTRELFIICSSLAFCILMKFCLLFSTKLPKYLVLVSDVQLYYEEYSCL